MSAVHLNPGGASPPTTTRRTSPIGPSRALLFAISVLATVTMSTGSAAAYSAAPGWQINSTTYPTNLQPGGPGVVLVDPLNIGAAPSTGPITITDTLPPGITATEAGTVKVIGGSSATLENGVSQDYWECSIAPGSAQNSVVTCHNNEENLAQVPGGAGGHCACGSLGPRIAQLPLAMAVHVEPGAGLGEAENQMRIEGGGAKAAAAGVDPIVISETTPRFGLARWDGWFSNADGTLDNTAGSVPYAFTTSLDITTSVSEGIASSAQAEPRNFKVELPPGLIGNPQAATTCTRLELNEEACPAESAVGMVEPVTSFALNAKPLVFNMVPPPGEPAQFAFSYSNISVYLDPLIRTGGDYGITTRIDNAGQKESISVLLHLWGVPNDPTHAPWHCHEKSSGCNPEHPDQQTLPPNAPLKSFLRLPTSCQGPQPTSLAVSGWSTLTEALTTPLAFFTHDAEGIPVGLTGCNQLPFDPTISSKPTTNVSDAPTGLEFDLHIPQPEVVNPIEEEVEGQMETVGAEPAPHEADLKNAVVTLPKGVAVNPASANGLAACTSAQFGLTSPIGQMPITTTPDPATCPDAAKIGSVEVDTPLLDHPIKGGVYVATPKDNPFGSLLAIYIAVDDEATGTVLKLAGRVDADPVTGQLVTTFANNPQLPFEDFHLNFFGGAHAALRTPQTCSGPLTTITDMTPWSSPEGADASPTDSFELTQGAGGAPCASSESQLPSKPSFTAGTLQPKAGAYSPFVLHLARADGSQEIKAIDTTLPEGLIGKLAGISECSDAQLAQAQSRNKLGDGALEIASPSCPFNSEVGTVNVGAGAGPDPYYVTGHAYLAGPYKGAPLSLEIITPAVAGPYDLGAVAVRTALYVNPETAQIHAVSDEIPHILQGIPLDVRTINLNMSRNQFTLNPTSCAKKTILGNATSVLNQSASLSSPFQVGECNKLGFAPKLKINLKGGTKRNKNPALTATVTYPKGSYANIASAQVTLPHSAFLDQSHIGTVCTRVQFAVHACPAASVYGKAVAYTPLLDQPLSGPVYLRSSSNKLPDLVADLNGQIEVTLDGKIDTGKGGGIRNTFQMVPDAPVSKFVLSMQGGNKGLLVNSENICSHPQKALAHFVGQNGKVDNYQPMIGNSCKVKKHKKRHAKR